MSENYLGTMTRIIPQYKVSHGKVEIYRDTGVSKKFILFTVYWIPVLHIKDRIVDARVIIYLNPEYDPFCPGCKMILQPFSTFYFHFNDRKKVQGCMYPFMGWDFTPQKFSTGLE